VRSNGFTMLVCEVDLRPAGEFQYSLRSPDGHEMWSKWVYREIKTTMTISGYPINAAEEERKTLNDGRGSRKQAFTGALDQLEAYLAQGNRA
jgi:uncharacterized protein YndB with AHSA1/START domain